MLREFLLEFCALDEQLRSNSLEFFLKDDDIDAKASAFALGDGARGGLNEDDDEAFFDDAFIFATTVHVSSSYSSSSSSSSRLRASSAVSFMVRKVLCVRFSPNRSLKKLLKSLGFQPFFFVFFPKRGEKKTPFGKEKEKKRSARTRCFFDI